MLDAYSSIGMPLFYKHWSFGKHFAHHEAFYRKGLQGLAYEIVINSSPCISYLMEENTATMQTLVIAHAAFGHNHFFKNNYLFRQWTDADGILDYLDFAKGYVAQCEERYGAPRGRSDARCRACADVARDRSLSRQEEPRSSRGRKARRGTPRARAEQVFNDLWRTVPTGPVKSAELLSSERRRSAARAAAGKYPLFPRKDGAAPAALAARAAADRAAHRAVLLSAEPDQGHERGHCDLRALPHHEPAARTGPALRRQFPRVPAVATPTWCSSPNSTIRAFRISIPTRSALR